MLGQVSSSQTVCRPERALDIASRVPGSSALTRTHAGRRFRGLSMAAVFRRFAFPPVLEGLRERILVGIVNLRSHGKAARESGEFHLAGGELLSDDRCRGFALEREIERYHKLLHYPSFQSLLPLLCPH